MSGIEKAKFSERVFVETIKRLRQENIRIHKSSDFSEDGYSIMLSIFIPFSRKHLTDKMVRELVIVIAIIGGDKINLYIHQI